MTTKPALGFTAHGKDVSQLLLCVRALRLRLRLRRLLLLQIEAFQSVADRVDFLDFFLDGTVMGRFWDGSLVAVMAS